MNLWCTWGFFYSMTYIRWALNCDYDTQDLLCVPSVHMCDREPRRHEAMVCEVTVSFVSCYQLHAAELASLLVQ